MIAAAAAIISPSQAYSSCWHQRKFLLLVPLPERTRQQIIFLLHLHGKGSSRSTHGCVYWRVPRFRGPDDPIRWTRWLQRRAHEAASQSQRPPLREKRTKPVSGVSRAACDLPDKYDIHMLGLAEKLVNITLIVPVFSFRIKINWFQMNFGFGSTG